MQIRAPMDGVPSPRFRLSLLGSFELTGPDGVVDLPSKKLAGLLAYLACTAPQPQPRDRLMTLFWGSHFDAQAKQNLRQALSRLRKVLGQDALESDGEVVSLNAGAVLCDVSRFEALVHEGSRDALSVAADLYRGRLIDDVTVSEEGWNEWLIGERERLLDLALGALMRLGEEELAAGRAEHALKAGRRAVALNNMREDAHRLIVQALAATGRKAEALKHYQDLVVLLKHELNAEPDATTKALVAELRSTQPPSRSPSVKEIAKAAPPQLDRPSIAVLPFANMSGDPGQDYFSDGISEDIITELSRFSELFVIARNSSFQYKGKSPDTRQVGRELGVRYVLEGSIRRAAERVRITTQLVDTATGAHHWAERYDRELKDVFAVQDDVVRSIVARLAVHLTKAEAERAFLKPPADWQAYDFCMRAIYLNASFFPSAVNVEIIYEMRKLLEQALAIDPNYARAKALLADSYVSTAVNPLDDDYLSASVLDRAHELARVAVQLDPGLAEAHASLGRVLLWKRQHEASIAEFERAAALNPNIADWRFAACLTFAGQSARAVEFFETNMHRDPYYSSSPLIYVGLSLYALRRHADALSPFREAAARLPDFRTCHVMLAATYGQLGQIENAQAEAAEVLRIDPKFTIAELRCILPFKRQEEADHFFEGLGAAGLPER